MLTKIKGTIAASLITLSVVSGAIYFSGTKTPTLDEQVQGKSHSEKANIKGRAIAQLDLTGQFVDPTYGLRIQIEHVEAIEGGVQVLARAWRGGKQLGFGADGSVEIERFRVFNPPILVTDPNGTVERQVMKDGVNVGVRKFREDPAEAMRRSLAHTIHLVGKEDTAIQRGKVGNTTSTFYPAAGANAPVDGFTSADLAATGDTWANIRSQVGTGANVTDSDMVVRLRGATTANRWRRIDRSIAGFDTSAIATDTVSSATLSVRGTFANNTATFGLSVAIDWTEPASTNALVGADYTVSGWDSVLQSDTTIAFGSWNTAGYNDFTLNATGRAKISGSGITWYGFRSDKDISNTEPTYSNTEVDAGFAQADVGGTDQDPVLVVVHAAPAATDTYIGLLES